MFFAGVLRRLDQYRSIGKLVVSGPGRWPKLLTLVSKHRGVFFTWRTALPAVLALLLTIVQLIASRLVWPEASVPPDGLTLGRLFELWPALFIVPPLGLAMLAFDVYSLVLAGNIDRAELEKSFDQAEYWLGSKTAHVVRVVTFGFVNPRKMVAVEVQKSLVDASNLLNFQLWWLSTQMALRFAFGLSMWLTWAIGATWFSHGG